MNQENILDLMNGTIEDVNFAKKVSDAIVQEQTAELDNLMRAIQDNIVNVPVAADPVIEKYLLQLTNALYFITTRCETFGFYDDITKANARLKYNEAYAENQLAHAADAKKPTQSDNQLYAEMNSVDENVLNIIYSRSVRIIKGKVESAGEMVRTLSKLLSAHMNMSGSTSTVRKLYE